MLEARNLSMTVGTKELLLETSFRVGDRDHVALVGLNGTGKSTLLRHISGTTYDSGLMTSGQLLKSAETTIGYLPQEINFEADLEKTALQYSLLANERLCQLSEKITRMEHELALPEQDYESEAYHQLIERFSDAMHEYEHLGGYTMQSDAEKVLAGLGFSEIDFHKKVKAFSGGWQMRLHLTKLLLQNPTLLLLDEPTNHLDVFTKEMLVRKLAEADTTLLFVSHDRAFLGALSNRVLELTPEGPRVYGGGYTAYVAQSGHEAPGVHA